MARKPEAVDSIREINEAQGDENFDRTQEDFRYRFSGESIIMKAYSFEGHSGMMLEEV